MRRLRDEASRLSITGDKTLVFYYEGSVTGLCGTAVSRAGAVYLGCSDAELGRDEEMVSTFEVTMVHELFHVFGAVASCAPNYDGTRHVSDPENDLMFRGVDREPRGGETFIDVGRDDYYGHGRPDCNDVSRSRFLEPAPLPSLAGSSTGGSAPSCRGLAPPLRTGALTGLERRSSDRHRPTGTRGETAHRHQFRWRSAATANGRGSVRVDVSQTRESGRFSTARSALCACAARSAARAKSEAPSREKRPCACPLMHPAKS